MEQPQKLTREQIIEQEMGPVYDFFADAELTGKHFTYKKIADVYPHVIKTIRRYAENYWNWFLIKESVTKPFTFSCRGLTRYPKQYFLDAHKPNQGQYFYHFALTMQAADAREKERQRNRKEAKALATHTQMPVVNSEQEAGDAQQDTAETLVPEQVLPEQVHIEKIEDDLEENGENGSEPSPSVETAPATQEPDHPFDEDSPEAVLDQQGEDAMAEPEHPVVSTAAEEPPTPQEIQEPAPTTHQRERTTEAATGKLVVTAVCLVVLVGLVVWWVMSKR